MKKTFLIVLGILSSLVILEIALRIGGFVFLSLQDYRNYLSVRQKGAYRILCLGESTTAGQYPPFLEEILNQRSTGIKFSVIDRGAVSTNSAAILLDLEKNLAKYKPNMIVAMMGDNDRFVIYYKDIPEARTKLFQYSRVYRLTRLIYNHALDKIKIAMQFKPKNSEAYYESAQLYQKSGKLFEAEKAFKRTIELDPKNDRSFSALGELLRLEGRLSEAEEAYKKAIELNSQNSWAYNGLGELWLGHGRPFESEELFKKAIELRPQNSWAYSGLARIYRAHRRFPEAEEAFRKSIEFNPKGRGANTELAELYMQEGKFLEAEEVLKKFLAVTPGDDLAYRAFENLYRQMNRADLAEEYRKKREGLGLNEYCPMAVNNYRRLKEILDQRGIRLVCVQYPMRSVETLKKIFEGEKGVVFVDNEGVFKEGLKQGSYPEYFRDAFAGDFGHCTDKGNKLLAQNIADVILKEVFGR